MMEEELKKKIEENVNSITCSVCVTINMGNYESIKLDAGMSITKKDDVPINILYNFAWEEIALQLIEKRDKEFTDRIFKRPEIVNNENNNNDKPEKPKNNENRKATSAQIAIIQKLRAQNNVIDSPLPETYSQAAEEINGFNKKPEVPF